MNNYGTCFLDEIYPPLPRSFVSAFPVFFPIITRNTPPMGFLRRRGPSELDAITRSPSDSENYIGGATLDRGFADEQRTSLPLLDLRRPYRRSSARAERSDENSAGPSEEKSYIPTSTVGLWS